MAKTPWVQKQVPSRAGGRRRLLLALVPLFLILSACGADSTADDDDQDLAAEDDTTPNPNAATEAPTASAAPSTAGVDCEPAVSDDVLIQPGVLTMAVNATIPPVQFINENGDLAGMRVELGEALAEEMCLEPEWINIAFDAMIPGLENGRWDVINTGLFFTEERAELMELVPYELQAISISVPADNEASISSTADLAGLAVGVEVGGYEEQQIRAINDEQVESGLEPMDIRTFNTFADAYQTLQAGQINAVVSVDATATFYQEEGDFDRAISGIAGSPASLAFVSTELAEASAEALTALMESGTYDAIFDEYGVSKIMQWDDWPGDFRVY